MTIEDKLKELVLSRYGSISEYTIVTGIAYSTFDSILRRGIHKATVSNLTKICNSLNIDIEALVNGDIVQVKNSHKEVKQPVTNIEDILAIVKQQLSAYNGLAINGKPADEKSVKTILDAMEIGLELAKRNQ